MEPGDPSRDPRRRKLVITGPTLAALQPRYTPQREPVCDFPTLESQMEIKRVEFMLRQKVSDNFDQAIKIESGRYTDFVPQPQTSENISCNTYNVIPIKQPPKQRAFDRQTGRESDTGAKPEETSVSPQQYNVRYDAMRELCYGQINRHPRENAQYVCNFGLLSPLQQMKNSKAAVGTYSPKQVVGGGRRCKISSTERFKSPKDAYAAGCGPGAHAVVKCFEYINFRISPPAGKRAK